MGLHPFYTAAEAESSRYLNIYNLIVCLSFTAFKNDKINIPLRVKSTVQLHPSPANWCVRGPLEWSLAAGCWWAASRKRSMHSNIPSLPPGSRFSIISGHKPCFSTMSLPCLRRTISKKVTIHSPCTFSLWPLCWDCQQGCQLVPFKKAQICCGNNEVQI